MPITLLSYLNLTNITKSSAVVDFETLDQIKENAPSSFRAGNRLITASDYKTYILPNFNNVVDDVYACNNNEYCTNFYAWLNKYDELSINIRQQNYTYANACDFNNIYVWLKPVKDSILSTTSKNNIVKACQNKKTLTVNIIPCQAFKYYITPFVKEQDGRSFQEYTDDQKQELRDQIIQNIYTNKIMAKIIIVKNKDFISSEYIQNSVAKIIADYFNQNSILGANLNTSEILSQIYDLGCINSVKTMSVTESNKINYVNGLSFIGFTQNIINFKDMEVFSQMKLLENFQYPELINVDSFAQYIEVVNQFAYITKNSKF